MITHLPMGKSIKKIIRFFENSEKKIIRALSKNIVTYDPIDRKLKGALSRYQLIERIYNLKFIFNPLNLLKTNLLSQDIQKLNEIGEVIENKIRYFVDEKNYKEVAIIFEQLKSLSIINHIILKRIFKNNEMLILSKLRKFEELIREKTITYKFKEAQSILKKFVNVLSNFGNSIKNQFNIKKIAKYIEDTNKELKKKEKIFNDIKTEKDRIEFEKKEIEKIKDVLEKEHQKTLKKMEEDKKQEDLLRDAHEQEFENLRNEQIKFEKNIKEKMKLIDLQKKENDQLREMQIKRDKEYAEDKIKHIYEMHAKELEIAKIKAEGKGNFFKEFLTTAVLTVGILMKKLF